MSSEDEEAKRFSALIAPVAAEVVSSLSDGGFPLQVCILVLAAALDMALREVPKEEHREFIDAVTEGLSTTFGMKYPNA